MKGWVKSINAAGHLFVAAAVLGIAWQAAQRPFWSLACAVAAYAAGWTLNQVRGARLKTRRAVTPPRCSTCHRKTTEPCPYCDDAAWVPPPPNGGSSFKPATEARFGPGHPSWPGNKGSQNG